MIYTLLGTITLLIGILMSGFGVWVLFDDGFSAMSIMFSILSFSLSSLSIILGLFLIGVIG